MKANETLDTYPMQFRDKLDEYLWKEHHILGGCCSSIESMKYAVAREVAEKLTDAFIEKAVKFLKDRVDIPYDIKTNEKGEPYADSYIDYATKRLEAENKFIENFKNYMRQ